MTVCYLDTSDEVNDGALFMAWLGRIVIAVLWVLMISGVIAWVRW